MKHKFFVFVSYSRLDINVARDIQQRLEKYIYSNKLVEPQYRPDDEKYVRPVFLDLTDLSTTSASYKRELMEKVAQSRYLLLICSENSAKSDPVRQEIEQFLKTHDNNIELITPVFIDRIVDNMPEVINNIVTQKNCPIYITARTKEGHVGRKYCFYHILENLLHVDFYKLYNRYEDYKRKKRLVRLSVLAVFTLLLLFTSVYGWISEKRIADTEKEKVQIAEELTKFERKTFPYSLVVGYVGNFLLPALNVIANDTISQRAHIIIYMPNCYEDLDINNHASILNDNLQNHYKCTGFITKEIEVPQRKRGISLVKVEFEDIDTPIYIDYANTVVAFKYVVDYKCNPEKNPQKINPTAELKDEMVRQYTNEFIESTLEEIPGFASNVHFVKTSDELKTAIKQIKQNP